MDRSAVPPPEDAPAGDAPAGGVAVGAVADGTLLGDALRCWRTRHRHAAVVSGGRTAEVAGTAVVDTGVPSPWFNPAVRLRPAADWPEVLAALREFYGEGERRRRHILFSPWPTPDLAGAGYRAVGHPPFMVRPAGGEVPPPPPGLRILPVADASTMRDFSRTLVRGYGSDDLGDLADTGILPPTFASGPMRLWVGYADGGPVSVAASCVAHGVAQVESVATVPAARGRGYGEALSWRATLADPTVPAVLLASDSGRVVYERMGFAAVFRWTVWESG